MSTPPKATPTCIDCGAPLNEGEAKCFTKCETCLDKTLSPQATPTAPPWAIEAAKEIHQQNTHWLEDRATLNEPTLAAIIAKHAPPPAAQPSDAAGLRIKVKGALDEIFAEYVSDNDNNGTYTLDLGEEATRNLFKDAEDRILTALAPHLKGEPGDAELLEWLEKENPEMLWYHDGSQVTLFHATFTSEEWRDLAKAPTLRAAIRAAMRGEGDKP